MANTKLRKTVKTVRDIAKLLHYELALISSFTINDELDEVFINGFTMLNVDYLKYSTNKLSACIMDDGEGNYGLLFLYKDESNFYDEFLKTYIEDYFRNGIGELTDERDNWYTIWFVTESKKE